MSQPGNSNTPLIAYWTGDPTSVPLNELNIVKGTLVIDPTNATVRQKTNSGANTTFVILATASGAQTPSSVAATGAVTSSSPTAGIGYATGAGGAVTQASSITTGVTLNKISGQITTVSSTLAAAASAVFTVTDSAVAATDVVNVSIAAYAGTGTPVAFVKNVVAGAFDIVLFNAHASAALNAVLVISFSVGKAVAA